MTGTPLATDTDSDGNVDTIPESATFVVADGEIPAGASLRKAYLYWGGTQAQPGGPLSGSPDVSVRLTPPNGSPVSVLADTTHGSDGGSSTFDMFLSRADVTSLIGGSIAGTYTVDSYSGLITDGASDNASAALLLIFSQPTSPLRCITVHDGLLTMSSTTTGSHTVSLANFVTAPAAHGSVTYYTMEGDLSGTGIESVTVIGQPSNVALSLSDALNPVTNMMNRTINTASPGLTSQVGVDLDRFDITPVLAGDDGALDVRYEAGTDRWWLGVTAVGIDIDPESSLSDYELWAFTNAPEQAAGEDFDGDGVPNAIEWVLGGGKDTRDLGKLPHAAASEAAFNFTFKRDQDSKTPDTTVQIEVGTTLDTWPVVYTVGTSPEISITDNSDGTETVMLNLTRAPDTRKFARLKVIISE